MEYNVCMSSDFDTFKEACNKWITNGWTPQGGVSLTSLPGGKVAYAQAFTR